MEPITRQEQLLDSIATGNSVGLKPITREEQYLSAIAGLTDFIPEKPITRKEMFYEKILESGGGGGGGSDTLKNIVAPTDTTGLERMYLEEFDALLYRVADFVPLDRYKGCQILDVDNNWKNGGETILSFDTGSFIDETGFIVSVATDNETITYYDVSLTFPKSGVYIQYINSSSGKIPMVQKIVFAENIPGKPYIDTSKITDFSYFFVNGRGLSQIENIDTSNANYFDYMFYRCTSLKSVPLFDTSNGGSFNAMFNRCSSLTDIPLFNMSNGVDFSAMFKECTSLVSLPPLYTIEGQAFGEMFYNCKSLTTIPLLDISKGTYLINMFYGCTNLKTLSITTAKNNLNAQTFQYCTALTDLTIGEGWAVSIYVHYSNNLTVESLHGMIENLADLTGQTAKTFQIGATNLAKIDEEHIAMLQAKNWNYS